MKLTNVCKAFGDNRVLENVNMTFNEGITCIMGPSGRGKTTLAYIIAGIIPPDSGSVDERENKKISLMFQEDRLLEWETALQNVLFVTKYSPLNILRYRDSSNPLHKHRERAVDLLTQANLSESINKKTSELSGGMKRRVCLCRALIADYDILILDEPFKGLDSGIKPSIMSMVKEHTAGKIVICITHDPLEADFLGGRLVEI